MARMIPIQNAAPSPGAVPSPGAAVQVPLASAPAFAPPRMTEVQPGLPINIAFESYANSLLASPTTPIMAVMSNAVNSVLGVTDNVFKIGTTVINGASERMRFTDAMNGVIGWTAGIIDGIHYAGKRISGSVQGKTTGDVLGDLGLPLQLKNSNRYEVDPSRRAISSEAFGLEGGSLTGQIVDVIGAGVNLPGTIMNDVDIAFKLPAMSSGIHRDAARMVSDGRAANMDAAKQMLMQDEAYVKQAVADADYMTFMNKAEIPFLRWVTDKSFESIPGLRWIIPFKRSIASMLEQTIERSPAAFLSGTMRDKIFNADPNIRATAHARMLSGMTLTSITALAVKDHITGQAPIEPMDRDLWEKVNGPENSLIFKPEGMQQIVIPLDNLGVVGQYMKGIARYNQWVANQDIDELFTVVDPNKRDQQMKEYAQLIDPALSVLYDNFWARNIVDFTSKLYKAVEKQDPTALIDFFERMGVKMIPIVGSRYITLAGQIDDPYKHDPNGLLDHFRLQMGTEYAQKVPYSYAWDGQKIVLSGFNGWGGGNLFAANEYKPADELEQYLLEIGLEFSKPEKYLKSKTITDSRGVALVPGKPIEYTDDEWAEFNTLRATGIPLGNGNNGPSIRELFSLLLTDGVRSLPAQIQTAYLNNALSGFYEQARMYMRRPGTRLNYAYQEITKANAEALNERLNRRP